MSAAAILVAALLRRVLGVSNLTQVFPNRNPSERRYLWFVGLAVCLSRQRAFL